MKNIYFALLFMMSCLGANPLLTAQSDTKNNVHVDLDLVKQIQTLRSNGKWNSTDLHVMVQGELSAIREAVERLGGRYKFGIKDIASVSLPAPQIYELLTTSKIQRVEGATQGYALLCDTMVIANNIDSAKRGLGGLPSPLTGKGVIVGIIDDGIDYRHADFQRPNGKSRIRWLWSQDYNDPQRKEPRFGYGAHWDSTYLTSNACPFMPNSSHGTQVSGIAAGNGRQVGRYTGIASDADLIVVQVRYNNFSTSLADAVSYIFGKAAELGRPCVINSSVGTYYGPHDGSELEVKVVNDLLNDKPGRFITHAAGNGRGQRMHVQLVTSGSQTKNTWLAHNGNINRVEFYGFADTAQFSTAGFSLSVMNPTNATPIGSSRLYNLRRNLPNLHSRGVDSIVEVLYTNPQNQPVTLKLYVSYKKGLYEFWFRVLGTSSSNPWQLAVTGNAKIDLWSSAPLFNSSDFITTPSPAPANFVAANDEQTIVSSINCSPQVLSVANYNNRYQYTGFMGTVINLGRQYGVLPGELGGTSSRGPTRDGRIKPEIAATGNFILASLRTSDATSRRASNDATLGIGGYHGTNGGTSMAAPVVCGAVALYLECQPNATWSQIMQAFTSTAKADNFTTSWGTLPNSEWGYGKLNALKASQKCIVRGCMDNQATNYNPAANVSDGSCTYLSIAMTPNNYYLQLYPVPASQSTQIVADYDLNDYPSASFKVYNALGQLFFEQSIESGKGRIALPKTTPQGIYFYTLQHQGQSLSTGKFVIND